jgi:hypothetical protein
MKEITIAEFEKLPKKGPISGKLLEVDKLYYIRDTRNKTNPVFIGRYVKPVVYYNDNSVSYNYRFEDVEYLVNPSKYKQNPSNIFGNVPKYYEVLYPTPTKIDIKNKKSMMNELRDFISEKKAEPHDETPTISFMGKDYRKVRDKFYNRSNGTNRRSSMSSRKQTKRSSSSSKPSSSKTRSSRKSSRRSSSNRSYYRSSSSSYRSY